MSKDQNLILNIDELNLENQETYEPVAFTYNDDLTGKILNARQEATQNDWDLFLAKRDIEKQENKSALDTTKNILRTTGNVVADVAGGLIEAPRQALGGFLDATAEAGEILENIFGQLPTAGEDYEPLQIKTKPRTVTGQGVRSISQFMSGFIPSLRAAKAIGITGKIKQAAGAGAIADATVFDAHEERLSDMVQQVPALQNPVTEYLASDPTDSEAEGRFKNAVEGLVLGAAVDGLVSAVKTVKTYRAAKLEAQQNKQTVEEAIEEKTTENVAEESQEFISLKELQQQKSVEIEVPQFFKTGAKEAKKKQAQNINLSNLETTDDIKKLIDDIAKADAKEINNARRQTIQNKDLPKLADDLGLTVDDLMKRRKGEAFNAEQILASRQLLIASGKNLLNLAKDASQGAEDSLAIFRRGLAQHRAIQQQVSGLTAEAGRALQSFNIIAKSAREQDRLISEALEAAGGKEVSQDMAKMISEIGNNPVKIGKFVKEAEKATTRDMLYEVWINGLLSSPATHMVNILSNTFTAVMAVGERKLASYLGDEIPTGEASAQVQGMLSGARDGLSLAWHAIKTGEVTDPLQKIELTKQRSISAENLNIAGDIGRAVDYIGEAVRISGRLLTAGDAFFKAVGYRMELNAQAFRQAYSEGLTGDAAGKRMADIINNPPENIRLSAIDASRYQTFTNELGPRGKSIENLRRKNPEMRIVIPFLRTPVNIFKYTFDRTPLKMAMGSYKSEIKAGGARAQLARAKIATGSLMMAVSADLAMSGQITGAGPVNRDMRNTMRMDGVNWQPYSILIGDTYYSYSRLDPTGALLGLAADLTEIMGQIDEATATEIATAASISVAQNLASKTYLANLAEFFDAFKNASTDPQANQYTFQNFLQRLAGSAVPAGIAAIEREVSPELNYVNSMLDNVKSRIPGFSKDLPPRRNVFGEVIVLQGGIGPDIMSPIYTSRKKKDAVVEEIVRNKVPLTMVPKVISESTGVPGRAQVELTDEQYDRFILLAAGKGLDGYKPLKQAFSDLFASNQYINSTDGPNGGKAYEIRLLLSEYKGAAKAQLIDEYGDLQTRIETEIQAVRRRF
tara:strand:+ start:1796 stop:5041 length:3246 start_codon:yes stop_codon:yes gene_type:complete